MKRKGRKGKRASEKGRSREMEEMEKGGMIVGGERIERGGRKDKGWKT